MDRPFNQLRNIFRNTNNDSKELLRYVFEKSDNISLWIIGLSIGGISIFANNIADIQNTISPDCLKLILCLLAISVTCGIIYRVLYLYLFVLIDIRIRGIDIAFSDLKMMNTETILTGNENFKQLIDKVFQGTGDDLSYLLPAFDKLDDSVKAIIYTSVIDHYHKLIEFAQRDVDLALDFAADTYSKFYGINKAKFLKKLKSPNSGVNCYRLTLVLTSVFYVLYILTFIGALFTFVYAA